MNEKSALIIIDLQKDFCKGGSLAVPDADSVVPVANKWKKKMIESGSDVFYTLDWHPAKHISFAILWPDKKPFDTIKIKNDSGTVYEETLWPVHCVQNTEGAKLHPDLDTTNSTLIYKGMNQMVDSYSAFFDNDHKTETNLRELLSQRNVSTLNIMGVATDYCVLYTVLDALKLGFQVNVILEGCRAVNFTSNTHLTKMIDNGAKFI